MSEPAPAAGRPPREEGSAQSSAGTSSSAMQSPPPSSQPPAAPRSSGRRRRRHLRGPVWLVCILLFLGCVLVLIDKTVTAVAQDKVATKLTGQRPFTGRPTVVIHGFPFLTQAVRGKYRDIEVDGPGIPVAQLGTAHIAARLHGVHIPVSSVGTGVGSVPVDHIDVTMSVPASRLGPALGVPGLKVSPSGRNVRMVAPMKLAGRRTLGVDVLARLSVGSRALRLTVGSVRVARGARLVAAPASVVSAVKAKLARSLPIPDLGLGVRVVTARVVAGQLVLTGTGDNVVLH